jgi:hypothetical protein
MSTRAFVIFLLLFSVPLLSRAEAKSGSDYTIINTGIKAGGCWYDNTRFITLQGHSDLNSKSFVVEGLFYLDVNNPHELKSITLSPLEHADVSRIYRIKCMNKAVLFSTGNRVYSVHIGEEPELIAEQLARNIFPEYVNYEAKYVLWPRAKLGESDTGISPSPDSALKDCRFKYLKAGFQLRCGPFHVRGLPSLLPQFVFGEYYWSEIIRVKGADGQETRIPNPEPPLKLADGTELKHGYLLRDLENRVVQQVKLEQPPYQIYHRHLMKIDPQGEYLYASCSKAGDHGDKRYTAGGRVCRFKLDGKNRDWEEAFAVQQSPKDLFSLQDLDVNGQGDVVVIHRGRGPESFWKYTASSQKVEFVMRAPRDLGVPLLSPNGRWVSFILQGEFHLAHVKGGRP